MKPTFPILAAAAVLLGASLAEAARPMARNSNIIIAPTPPLQNSLRSNQFRGAEYAAATRTGAIGITSPSALGVPGQQTFGALPGNPPNAALPSLGNSGSAIAPDQGSSATGVNTQSTNVNGGM